MKKEKKEQTEEEEKEEEQIEEKELPKKKIKVGFDKPIEIEIHKNLSSQFKEEGEILVAKAETNELEKELNNIVNVLQIGE